MTAAQAERLAQHHGDTCGVICPTCLSRDLAAAVRASQLTEALRLERRADHLGRSGKREAADEVRKLAASLRTRAGE